MFKQLICKITSRLQSILTIKVLGQRLNSSPLVLSSLVFLLTPSPSTPTCTSAPLPTFLSLRSYPPPSQLWTDLFSVVRASLTYWWAKYGSSYPTPYTFISVEYLTPYNPSKNCFPQSTDGLTNLNSQVSNNHPPLPSEYSP